MPAPAKKAGKESGKSKKPGKTGKSKEISSLIQAFEYFTETTEKLRESYDILQEKISSLDLELEKKNEQISVSLREMDSIKNHLENILESMNMGVIVINLDGEVSIFNRVATEITGFSQNEVLRKPYEELLGNNTNDEYNPIFTLKSGIERRNKEKEIFTKDGKTIPVEFSTSVVCNETGGPIGVVELFSDLRDIKKLHEEVQQARTHAALGEMAGNVAHEIRNPLGGIGGFAALLERDLDVEDPRRNLVRKIIEGVSRLNRIATNLLVYTRPMRPKKRPVDITALVEDVLTLVQVELEQDESKIKLNTEFQVGKLDVPLDPELFQQVFLNIVKNAVQAMDDSGELFITVRNIVNEEKVEIAVKDQGPGITEEEQAKLFLPFYTSRADGTGLGLSIAKKIMDTHNGDILVDSKVGEGSTFRILFPY